MSAMLMTMVRPRGNVALAAAFASSSSRSSGTFSVHAKPSPRSNHQFAGNIRNKNDIVFPQTSHHRTSFLSRYPPLAWSRFCHVSGRQFFTSMFMTSTDSDDESEDYSKTIDSEWNIKGLKQEVNRLVLRSHKKIGKASTRVRKANELVEKLTTDENATMEQLEACPNVDALQLELQELQTRLQTLNQLNDSLASVPSKGQAKLPKEIAQLAVDLGVEDQPPQQTPRGPKKTKGPRQKNPPKTRLPYRKFYTVDNTEIRVGKQAPDNDELSLNPEHRSGSDWWMHASGCPGSHVVIRNSDENIDEEVVQDAAALAARQSKCNGSVIKVSMTRCRDISKPRGAKAGLVQLTGQVRTVTVTMKEAEKRLERLDETVQIN